MSLVAGIFIGPGMAWGIVGVLQTFLVPFEHEVTASSAGTNILFGLFWASIGLVIFL